MYQDLNESFDIVHLLCTYMFFIVLYLYVKAVIVSIITLLTFPYILNP